MNLNRAKRANEIPKRGTDPENRCKKFLPQVKFLVVSANSQRYGKEREKERAADRERKGMRREQEEDGGGRDLEGDEDRSRMATEAEKTAATDRGEVGEETGRTTLGLGRLWRARATTS
jgi:hypothetical protein